MAASAVAAVSLALPARSQSAMGATTLPPGAPLTFVLDDTLSNAKPRPGTTLRMHLRDALVVGSLTAAAAGTVDRLRISTAVSDPTDAEPRFSVTVAPLSLGPVGRLPLTVATPMIALANLKTGSSIVVKTEAALSAANGRVSMHIPVPFALTNDAPFADWTPIPMRTGPTVQSSARPGSRGNAPGGGGPRGRRSPVPASPSPSPSPASSSPGPSPSAATYSPTPGPSPTGAS